MMNFFEKFPWAKFTMAVGGGGMGLVVLVAVFRLALGKIFPAGYDGFLYALVGMAGAGGLIGVGKRATDYTLAAIKTGDAATIATVIGPPKVPDADTAPVARAHPNTDPAIVAALESVAREQQG